MIEFGAKKGCGIIDFGPSLNSDESHVRFKMGFGGQKVSILTFVSGSPFYVAKKWFTQKRHALKIYLKKIGGRNG